MESSKFDKKSFENFSVLHPEIIIYEYYSGDRSRTSAS